MEEAEEDLKFIIDEPAEVDFFDTHSPVAAAISHAIVRNPQLKIIGLLGRWGSGKSTIVRDVNEQLRKADKNFLMFTYDAWLHQNDPLRRSFFESLVTFLADRTPIDREKWDRKVKILSGSIRETNQYDTPVLTGEAKLFFLCAAAFAFGLSFLSLETFQDGMGATTTGAGFFTLCLAMLLILGPVAVWTYRWLLEMESGKRSPFLPALIFNKNLGHVHSLTYQPVDATSIEFGKEFRALMREIKTHDVRLIIVIDNMDRIDDEEAMKIWASARSFFLSAGDDNHIDFEPYHPTVILPVDAKSISQMFAVGTDPEQGRRLARSFINKTFDVTFDVPTPVMSDWKRYLVDKMKYCLGSEYSDVRAFRTRQFLDVWFAEKKIAVTPREINKILNHMVALLIRCRARPVTFETLAYYSINSDWIADEIEKEVSREYHPAARYSDDWAREIAALHFGVGVDDAGQVLMTAPIQRAIVEYEPYYLEPYRKVVGYGDIFELVTANLPQGENSAAPLFEIVTNAARLLAIETEDQPWRPAAWRNLARAFADAETAVPLEGLHDRMAPLFDHIGGDDASALAGRAIRMLDNIVSTSELNHGAFKEMGPFGSAIVKYGAAQKLTNIWFDVSGDAARYVRVLSGLRPYPTVQRRMRSETDHELIVAELSRRLSENAAPASVPDLLPLLAGKEAEDIIGSSLDGLDPLFGVAEATVRSQTGEGDAFRAAVRTLGLPVGSAETRHAALERLGNENIFTGQLSAAAGSGDGNAVAVMAAAMIWKQLDFHSPVGDSWPAFLQKYPSAPERINLVIDDIAEPREESAIDILMKSFDDQMKPRNLVRALMADRIRRRALGPLNPSKILRNMVFYSRMIETSALQEEFVALVSGYMNVWNNVQTGAWTNGLYQSALLLRKKGGDKAERIHRELVEKAQNSSVEEWTKALLESAEPFRIATKLLTPAELKLGTGSALAKALGANASAVAGTTKRVARWFALAEFLTAPARRKACEEMAKALGELPPMIRLRVLKAGGRRFFVDAAFVKRPDECIELIILPLTRSEKGRHWLKDHVGPLRKVVDNASEASRAKLGLLVKESRRTASGERSDWGALAARSWGFKD